MKIDVADALYIVGNLAAIGGFGWIHPVYAVITAGIVLVISSFLLAMR